MNDIKSKFIHQGYIIIPKLFDLENIDRLKSICTRALDRRRNEYLKTHSTFPKKNCSLPEQIEYFADYSEVIDYLLNTIADQQILSILDCICDRQN
jgi:hypothetical protein